MCALGQCGRRCRTVIRHGNSRLLFTAIIGHTGNVANVEYRRALRNDVIRPGSGARIVAHTGDGQTVDAYRCATIVGKGVVGT